MDTPAGSIRATLPPASIDGVVPVMAPVPALGAHTDAILDELGFDSTTVAGWHDDGMI